ncbi:MAG: hypothetical protein WEC75_12915 [Dehalococcoidia bacterium]
MPAAALRSCIILLVRADTSGGDLSVQLRDYANPPARGKGLHVVEGASRPSLLARPDVRYAAALAAAVALGGLVRASFVLGADFPLNDGGMFFVMARDLQANGYALPGFTAYNGGEIPFAYPPLGIYAAALFADLTPVSMLDAFRFLPLLVSTFSIVAFFLLARTMLSTRVAVVVAVTAFALVPRSFIWMIMGGGITRSFGFVFAILTVQQALLLYTRGGRRHAALAACLGALTLLSHVEMAWFAAFSCGLLFAIHGRSRGGVISSAAVAAGVLVLAAPWWANVLAQHGIEPFVAAADTRSPEANPVVLLIQFRMTAEPLFPLIATLAALGAFACMVNRQYVLPVWVAACALLDPRGFGTVASVPIALLAGIAVQDVLVPFLHHPARTALSAGSDDLLVPRLRPGAPAWLLPSGGVIMACYALIGTLVAAPTLLTGLAPDERDAMAWVAASTPEAARVLVVSGEAWDGDRTSEWLPALAGRRSVATVQGREWLREPAFDAQIHAHRAVQECAQADAACLTNWARDTGRTFDFVYLPRLSPRTPPSAEGDECCPALRASLFADTAYRVVYDGPGATVFAKR